MLHVLCAGLFLAIEETSVVFLPDFGPAYMSELLWSMAMVEHKPSPDFISVSGRMGRVGDRLCLG